ncbi:DEAD/DEAH box helicase [Streptomyces sp. NPDC093225]|uniref:DEAD/DEAH box helicase n=1 Tax=Streptomyces sp. NPDC093225 TaxID=3366034 RepID=UPI003830D8BB
MNAHASAADDSGATEATPVDVDGVAAGAEAADGAESVSFADLGLPAALLESLTGLGVTRPFPVQAAALPAGLAGHDVLGRARTGSGKTLAFGLPLLARTAARRAAAAKRPHALVLVPTRELAQQVADALAPHARALGVRVATVVGGLSIGQQAKELRAGAEVVIATPGRLADLVDRRDCALDAVRITVLDEADRMCDMGFGPQVTRLLDQVRPDGQRMLFSATLDGEVDGLVQRYLVDSVLAAVDGADDVPVDGAEAVEHHLLQVQTTEKYVVAAQIAAREGRVLMFLASKAGVDRFTRELRAAGVKAAALHSGKSQPLRTHTLEQFRTGAVNVLVATDVAARGLHVEALELVVNVDAPTDPKDYVHRGGRTARAGAGGSVVTLVTPGQRRDLNRMLTAAGIRAVVTPVRPGEPELARITGARSLPEAGDAAAPAAGPAKGLGGDGTPGAAGGSGRPAGRGRGAEPARGAGSGAGPGSGSGSAPGAGGRDAESDRARKVPFRGMGSGGGRSGGQSRKSAEARQLADARKAARVRKGR